MIFLHSVFTETQVRTHFATNAVAFNNPELTSLLLVQLTIILLGSFKYANDYGIAKRGYASKFHPTVKRNKEQGARIHALVSITSHVTCSQLSAYSIFQVSNNYPFQGDALCRP